jgi:probable F420-dependent oxidoreductase
MKWGIQFANTGPFADPDLARVQAQAAEEAGFDFLCGCEHVVIPVDYTPNYPFSQDGKLMNTDFASEDAAMPDPIAWMGFIAGITSRINLTTGVVILPQRNPVVLAKQLLTLDQLSKGRCSIGIGVGWLEEEFDAINVPWARRGARCDEYIRAMRELWYNDVSSFDGEFVHFSKVKMLPNRPVSAKGIPIVVGGHGDAAARRAGKLGDGFFPAIFPNSELWARLPGLITTMRAAAVEAGHDPDKIEITSGGTRSADGVQRFRDLGVSRLVIRARSRNPQELRDELMRFGDEVIATT